MEKNFIIAGPKINVLAIYNVLKEAGVQAGDTVKVFDYLLEWED